MTYIYAALFAVPYIVIFLCLACVSCKVLWNFIGLPFRISSILRPKRRLPFYYYHFEVAALAVALGLSYLFAVYDSLSFLVLGLNGRFVFSLKELAVWGLVAIVVSSLFRWLTVLFLRLFIQYIFGPLRRYLRRRRRTRERNRVAMAAGPPVRDRGEPNE